MAGDWGLALGGWLYYAVRQGHLFLADFIFWFPQSCRSATLNKYEINTKCVVGCLCQHFFIYIFLRFFFSFSLIEAFPVGNTSEGWLLSFARGMFVPSVSVSTPPKNPSPSIANFPLPSPAIHQRVLVLCCFLCIEFFFSCLFGVAHFAPAPLSFDLWYRPSGFSYLSRLFLLPFGACWGDVLNICQMKSR